MKLSADSKAQIFLLWVAGIPYDQIKTGNEELQGVFRYTDEHCVEKSVKKSTFRLVILEPGMEKI